jgi:hypothetical protein
LRGAFLTFFVTFHEGLFFAESLQILCIARVYTEAVKSL